MTLAIYSPLQFPLYLPPQVAVEYCSCAAALDVALFNLPPSGAVASRRWMLLFDETEFETEFQRLADDGINDNGAAEIIAIIMPN